MFNLHDEVRIASLSLTGEIVALEVPVTIYNDVTGMVSHVENGVRVLFKDISLFANGVDARDYTFEFPYTRIHPV